MSDEALAVLAGLVLANGKRWGDVAAPFQWDDARAVLGGPCRLAYITRPRGASKTTDTAGMGIAALLTQLPPMARAYAVAADRDQGQLIVDAIDGFHARTPGLRGQLKVDTWKVTALRTGATLEVLAADAAGAMGKLPHLIIVDERAHWRTTAEPERMWRAMFSALPKIPGSRLVILTAPGDPAHPAHKILERARASARWYVNEMAGPCPWADPDDLAEQREELPEWEYARLHLGQWMASADRLTSLDDLRACVTLDGPQEFGRDLAGRYAIGVDVGLKNDRSVVVVCHWEPVAAPSTHQDGSQAAVAASGAGSWPPGIDVPAGLDPGVAAEFRQRLREAGYNVDPPVVPGQRRIVLDRIGVWAGTRSAPLRLQVVEDFIAEVSERYQRPPVVYDPYQAVGSMQRLQARGVHVVEFSFSSASVGRLGLTLHQLIRSHNLALPDDPELIDELANVRLRETSPGVVRLDHDAGKHDDRAVAIALAARHLLDKPEEWRPSRVAPSYGDPWQELMDNWDREWEDRRSGGLGKGPVEALWGRPGRRSQPSILTEPL